MQGTADVVGPRPDRHPMLARILAGVAVVGLAVGLVITVLDALVRPPDAGDPWGDLVFVLAFAAFPVIGYVLATRRPENSIGWLMLAMGTFFGVSSVVSSLAGYLLHTGREDAAVVLYAIDSPSWVPIVVLPVTFLLLLFPDGHLPSRRWRWFAWVVAVNLAVLYFAIMIAPDALEGSPLEGQTNPLTPPDGIWSVLEFAQVLIFMIPIGVLGSLTALVLRFRRSTGIERLQLRWLLTAAAFVAVLYSTVMVLSFSGAWGGDDTSTFVLVLQNGVIVSFVLIPIAIGVSILRYRLFDIDVVINKALLFGALAIFITIVYVVIVAGVGVVVGSRASPVLSAVAAAVVALAFQPLRRRAQRIADRLVYGKRATPYEVLSEFSERVGQTYANDELLPRMARALAEGTGAARADVWVREGDELVPEAAWPEDADTLPARSVGSTESFATGTTMLEPVRHHGELLGALSIEKRAGESLSTTEEKLVADLAAQAGLVLRNAGLTQELLRTIDELKTSRQRLVTAQDEERRKLERNLHDGAQQQLVALTVKLGLLERLVERDPAKAGTIASQLQGDATEALEELRDLARGIYPPLLADKGLVAALESQARKSTVEVVIEADGVGRYAREAEAAVYFSCLEALQNVAKYASASRAVVELSDGDGRLRFGVTDDGAGFDPSTTSPGTGLQGIADRLAALGGEIEVRSAPGEGTSVMGSLPIG